MRVRARLWSGDCCGCCVRRSLTGHDIDGIGTAHTDGGHAETTGVGSVRVSSDHETTGESIVLQNDLEAESRATTIGDANEPH